MHSALFSMTVIATLAAASCKTTSEGSGLKNQNLRRNQQTPVIAESVLSFDVKTLKAHLANAQDPAMTKLGLWSAFLEEPQQEQFVQLSQIWTTGLHFESSSSQVGNHETFTVWCCDKTVDIDHPSVRLHFPALRLFTSVPVSAIPASHDSPTENS